MQRQVMVDTLSNVSNEVVVLKDSFHFPAICCWVLSSSVHSVLFIYYLCVFYFFQLNLKKKKMFLAYWFPVTSVVRFICPSVDAFALTESQWKVSIVCVLVGKWILSLSVLSSIQPKEISIKSACFTKNIYAYHSPS